jgi:asparagine synthase (glutamine-hydrolysing)
MCGICGQYNFIGETPVFRPAIEAMTDTIVHRGPDDEGYYVSGPVGLGFRRLSILDLAGGHQPMSDQDQTVWVVFNGEIYNFPELKRELECYGHVFRTTCDTEVIVNGYKQWGDAVFDRLSGMFGLAIWDVRRKRLVIARDPFGIKLVYYKIENKTVYFGSEIRAILAAPGQSADIDPTALNLFLRYRYTPSPYTIYSGIKKLAPGTMLIFERGKYTLRRWYQSKPTPFSPPKTIEQATDELTELYKQALKRHLLSDVPVGLLLSGGVDSGLLLALMNLYGKSWRTYTAGYGSVFADDELADAQDTASLMGSEHTPVPLSVDSFKFLPKIVSQLEEPIASSSIVPMYFVCERARHDVKVALMGQGPDELFGGYRRHLGLRYAGFWTGLPSPLRRVLAGAIVALPRNETLKRGIHSLHVPDRLQRYQQILSLLPEHEMDSLFRADVLTGYSSEALLSCWRDLTELSKQTGEFEGFQFLELRSTLPDELLMYADKLSMAHGLEVRVPYLDREVVEYVERLPAAFKIRRGSQKWLHRRVCRSVLPKRILNRKKRGFAVNVVDDWFRGGPRNPVVDSIIDSRSDMYKYLDFTAVQDLLKKHQSGREDNHKVLFSVVMFEQWLRVRQNSPISYEHST